MIGLLKKHRYFRDHDLKSSYDVVIIGAGAHGLATAYYLAKRHGIKNDRRARRRATWARGASGRNTTIIRSNYLTPEGARFYEASVKLYETLVAGARLQHAVLPARPPHPGPLRPLA